MERLLINSPSSGCLHSIRHSIAWRKVNCKILQAHKTKSILYVHHLHVLISWTIQDPVFVCWRLYEGFQMLQYSIVPIVETPQQLVKADYSHCSPLLYFLLIRIARRKLDPPKLIQARPGLDWCSSTIQSEEVYWHFHHFGLIFEESRMRWVLRFHRWLVDRWWSTAARIFDLEGISISFHVLLFACCPVGYRHIEYWNVSTLHMALLHHTVDVSLRSRSDQIHGRRSDKMSMQHPRSKLLNKTGVIQLISTSRLRSLISGA